MGAQVRRPAVTRRDGTMRRSNDSVSLALRSTALIACIALSPPSAAAQDPGAWDAETRELLRLDAEIMRKMIIDRDPTLMDQMAVEELHVLAPGGLVEDRQSVLAGANSWDARDVTFTPQRVVRRGPVTLVFARIDIDGEMRPVGRLGPLKAMSVWIRESGQWRLLARSLTPCIDMLIQLGRC